LSPRALVALPLCAALLLGLAVHRLACSTPERPWVEFIGPTMGTTYSVKLVAPDLTPEAHAELGRSIESELERVNELMSTYRPDSELSRFNRLDSTEPYPISPETFEVFEVAQAVSERSGGAFDVTVGPLVAAWGFGATDRPPRPPAPEELAALRQKVGYQRLRLHSDEGAISKSHPDTWCDLSAIAKGYAVDRVAEAISSRGHESFLIEVGGELAGRGTKRGGQPWRVGIERPDNVQRVTHEVVELRDRALATSGDYRNYYEVDGRRISHTIDPRQGRPIRHSLASVSVIHESAVWADALATALNVMGAEEGLGWAELHEVAALFLVRTRSGDFRELATKRFEALRAAADVDSGADDQGKD
jgi:thiamine biosynthesis lipoprotein